MNKQEALNLMHKGIKITHYDFAHDEWMTINNEGNILLEDGCQCSIAEFFSYRTGESWDKDYYLYESEKELIVPNPYLLDIPYPYKMIENDYLMSKDYGLTKKQREANIVPVRTTPKIGRNEPCTCGSGLKNKKCCKQF